MNFRLVVFLIVISFFLSACNGGKPEGDALVKKRITQKIESDAMGMIKDLKIESIEKLTNSTYKGVHSFSNPMFKKQMRVTRKYTFTENLDSIIEKEDLKIEMKSEGEWVEAPILK